jgi:hypothetical protein
VLSKCNNQYLIVILQNIETAKYSIVVKKIGPEGLTIAGAISKTRSTGIEVSTRIIRNGAEVGSINQNRNYNHQQTPLRITNVNISKTQSNVLQL